MSYDPHERVRELFPIFNDIEQTVNLLNELLVVADKNGLSIKFVQAIKQISAPNGKKVDGLPEPKLHMTTMSWRVPSDS